MTSPEHFLHFYDSQELRNDYNKSSKIQRLVALLIERFELLINQKNIYRNRNGVHVESYVFLKKRSYFGIKAFVFCETGAGYNWNIILYSDVDTIGINCDRRISI